MTTPTQPDILVIWGDDIVERHERTDLQPLAPR